MVILLEVVGAQQDEATQEQARQVFESEAARESCAAQNCRT